MWVEEIDALAPDQSNTLIFTDGTEVTCNLLCDLMHLEGAECLATYADDFYAGTPAITKNQFGKGTTYYIGTNMNHDGIAKVLEMAASEAGVAPVINETTELEVTCRKADNCTYYFIINFKDKEILVPTCFADCQDILTGETIKAGNKMAKYDVKIVAMDS